MSYDISIGGEDFNITYNVAPMFYRHNEKGIRFIYGKTGEESMRHLLNMYDFFITHKKELEKMNPKNGWGSWESTVNKLNRMLVACVNNPLDIWEGD